jgi:iron complex transport system ATP-binding protein
MNRICSVENLSFSYNNNDKILDDLKFQFFKGKFYSIVGPNGSGKTTLLKALTKNIPIEKSTVLINDMDIVEISNKESAKLISYVPQIFEFSFDFTVKDIVLMGRNPHVKRFSKESKDDMDKVYDAMEITGVRKYESKSINELSGGEKQRAVIARAICQDSDIMILDEPISQLDIHHQYEIMTILENLVLNYGKTVICVLHDLNIAAEFSDEIIMMKEGKIFYSGSSDIVLTEKNIGKIYNMPVKVMKNPLSLKPHIFPVARNRKSTGALKKIV